MARGEVVGRVGRAVAAAMVLAGCGEVDAPRFTEGELTEDHLADRARGCTEAEHVRDRRRGTTALGPGLRSVSRRLMAEEARASFDFAVSTEAHGDGAGVLTLDARGRAEDNVCGNGCEGASAVVRFAWQGSVVLPPREAGYRVRVTLTATRAVSRGPERFYGECALETPWRSPVVVELGTQTREFDVAAGTAVLRLRCDREAMRDFAGIGCYGGGQGPPEAFGLSSWMETSLRARVEVTPR